MAPARPRVLSERQLNRALLARQLLLERARIPLPRALERMGGLQAQYAPSMYIGLWSRVAGFRRDDLTRALERRSVVQGTLMRATIHLVSKADYWPLAIAIRSPRRAWWLRVTPGAPKATDLAAAAERLRRRLRDGPVTRAELEEIVGRSRAGGVGLWVDLIRVPPSGTWDRRKADLFGDAEDWVGPARVCAEAALEHLIRRYLGAFGPAAPADLALWAGLPAADLTSALDRLRLRRFRTEAGQELVDVPRGPLPDPDTPAPVRFLPTWDAILLVHARGKGILAEEHRPAIFHSRNPQSVPTFLVDGRVAGTWRYEAGRVRLQPFGRLSRSTTRELEAEAEQLAALHDGDRR